MNGADNVENTISGIYKIACRTNGKLYVGSSVNVGRRWYEHKSMLKNGSHHSPYLQHSWDKYGEEDFDFNFLEKVVDKEKLIDREQFWIDKTQSANKKKGFNVSPVANSPLGRKHTPETIALLSVIASQRVGRKMSPQAKQNMSLAAVKRNLSKEYLEKQKASHLGKKHMPEAKEKIRRSKLGKTPSNLGVPHTEETIEKLKQKAKRGAESHKALLSDEDVRKSRELLSKGLSCQKIADQFGVSKTTIYDIKRGKTWKRV